MSVPMDIVLTAAGCAPAYTREGDAALDLRASEDVEVRHGELVTVGLGFACAIPAGWCGEIVGRSGNSAAGHLVVTGIVDAAYRGEVRATLLDMADEPWIVRAGDRVAQMLVRPASCVELSEAEALGETDRGACGFGSSGVR